MQPNPNPSLSIAATWAQRFRDPLALTEFAQAWLDQAADDRRVQAFGHLQMGWGHRYRGEIAQAAASMTRAQALYEALDDAAGLANVRDLTATLWAHERRMEEALQLLESNLALAPGVRLPIERMITHDRRGFINDLIGDRDASLRERYAMLESAREDGDPAAIAMALAMLGGIQADLYNLDDADRLCTEALSLVGPDDAMQAWSLVALNHMNALVALERGALAAEHARRLLTIESRLNQRAAEQRFIVYADAFTLAGDPEQAQLLLDHSVSLRAGGQQSLISFTSAQCRTWNARGLYARTRALAEAYLADPNTGTDPAEVPTELLRILQGLSVACEALGDTVAALAYQRQAFAVHEAVVGRSARARRLTLEVQHRLDRERWERAEAQRRQRDAEIEGQRLSALNRELAAANLAKSRFLAAASHDLRQPLHAMSLYLAAVQSLPSSAPQRDLLDRMDLTMATLAALFESLMDLSRIDAGVVSPQWQSVPLAPLLSSLHQELSLRARTTGSRIRLRLPPGADQATARSDPLLLSRILRNLLDNALKYAPGGRVLLALRKDRRSADSGPGDHWRIEVRDSGPGIGLSLQDKVFEEFYRIERTSGHEPGGLGLGLSIVRRLSLLLEHPLSLRSAEGAGSAFTVRLPALEPTTALAEQPASAPVPGRSLHIAVIEDDPVVRDSLCRLLDAWGHRVSAAADPRTLLHSSPTGTRSAEGPELIIADYQLGLAGNGLDAIRILREAFGRDLPALIITGDSAPQDLRDLQTSGLAWLAKPVRPMRLRGWLAAVAANDGQSAQTAHSGRD